ncbi:MAG: STAS domain-containing protein [Gammaproteobacteria bacterium]|nr:STAS domain-containing protein [Gammaproteobacteria bacterium]
MSVSQNVSFDGKRVQINISGRFDYKVSKDFRDAYRHIPGREGIAYHVDLKEVDFMDSSALGMLLLLREHAKCRGGDVVIEHPSETIDKILKVANFEQLFEIDYSTAGRTGTTI